MSKRTSMAAAIISLLMPLTCAARLTELIITQSAPLAGGISWGSTGPYEKLTGALRGSR